MIFLGTRTSFAVQQEPVRRQGILSESFDIVERKSSIVCSYDHAIDREQIFPQTKSDDYTVNFGTKMYVDQDVSPIQRFSSIIQYNYLADVEKLNFADARSSSNSINGWIKAITNGRIKDLVTEDSLQNAVVLLINAMYFEGTWRTPFNKTFTAPFHGSAGKRDRAFMERTGNHYYFYSKHLNSKILRIPYSGRRYSMFIILPNENQNLDATIDLLNSETLKNEVWHMDEVEVHAVLPKFKFDTSLHLNEVVKKVKAVECSKKTFNHANPNP